MDDETRETNKTLIQRWTVVKKENKITVSPNYVKIVKISNIKKSQTGVVKKQNKKRSDRTETNLLFQLDIRMQKGMRQKKDWFIKI